MADYNKPKPWDGKDLKGTWELTIKRDGVRAFIKDGVATSRANKPLYNLEGLADGDYEIFVDDWNTTVSRVRTQEGKLIEQDEAYSLDPVDARLRLGYLENPNAGTIYFWLDAIVENGDEGLVLRQGDKWIKVKPKDTTDVAITGIQMGTKRIEGLLGAFITDLGKVGTGFDDKQRKELLDTPIGTIIEVEHEGWTKGGKMKHPAFKRVRFDKNE